MFICAPKYGFELISLLYDFVPLYLGASHLERAEWVLHNTPLVNELFNLKNNEFVSCADATYSYCKKYK